jgi:uridylate kinase
LLEGLGCSTIVHNTPMGTNYKERIIMSIGGSLIVPDGGIGSQFLAKLNTFVRKQLAEKPSRQFFLVAGGGATARHYIEAGREVVHHELSRDDLDWLGIHSSRLNAHLIRTIFRDIAHPYIIKHYEIIRKVTEQVVVAAAWKPGWSTDYDAVLLCEDYDANTVINLSNISQVCDSDPKTNPHAKPIDRISWADFRHMVGTEWTPGMNAPFDPIASKKAEEIGIKVVVMHGDNFENIENFFEGKQFVGTVIE